jgi:hypothetical protein
VRFFLRAAALVLLASAGAAARAQVPPDPVADEAAVQAVCGRCHAIGMFKGQQRSWDRWNDVFAQMTRRGATGTDEQLERVTRWFLENQTVVNVNTAPADELGLVLDVDPATAEAIVVRRQQRPFRLLAELREFTVQGRDVREWTARVVF